MNEDIKQQLQLALSHHQSGRLQDAEGIYQSIIRTDPQQADAWHLLGVIAHQVGRNELAVQSIEKAINIDPQNPDYHNNCGEAYRALKKFDLAISHYQQALLCKPDFAGAQMNLGNAMKDQGRLEDAARYYRAALDNDPDFFIAHNNLGIVLRELGRLEEAVTHYRKAIKLMPDYAEAYNNLGNALQDISEYQEAIDNYKLAIEKVPEYSEAYSNLGNALRELGRYDKAISSHRTAISLNPDFPLAYYNLGITLDETRQSEEAVQYYQRAIELNPDYAAAHNNIGNTLVQLGKKSEAIQHFKKAIKLNTEFVEAHRHLSMVEPDTAYIEKLESILLDRNRKKKDAIHCHFALGNIYHHEKRYDEAFFHYKNGNKLRRTGVNYSIDDHSAYVDNIIHAYNSLFFEQSSVHTGQLKLPVLIVGMPRSGTTLVEQILASHPVIAGAGELSVLRSLEETIAASFLPDLDYPACISQLSPPDFGEHAQHYLAALKKVSRSAERITDKMPDNFLRIGLFKAMFPHAKVIHCERNPYDTCLSIFINYFVSITGNEYTYSLVEIGKYYNDYRKIMQHWKKVFPEDIHSIRYEDLVLHPETCSKNMLAFLELDWDPVCLDFHLNRRSIRTTSSIQVRKPLYTDSIEQWRNYETHLAPLTSTINIENIDE